MAKGLRLKIFGIQRFKVNFWWGKGPFFLLTSLAPAEGKDAPSASVNGGIFDSTGDLGFHMPKRVERVMLSSLGAPLMRGLVDPIGLRFLGEKKMAKQILE